MVEWMTLQSICDTAIRAPPTDPADQHGPIGKARPQRKQPRVARAPLLDVVDLDGQGLIGRLGRNSNDNKSPRLDIVATIMRN